MSRTEKTKRKRFMKGLVRGEYHFKWLARTIITSMLRETGI